MPLINFEDEILKLLIRGTKARVGKGMKWVLNRS